MSMSSLKRISIASGTVGVTTQITSIPKGGLDELIAGIKSNSAEERTQAWQSAGKVGALGVKPLAKVMSEGELEVARAAKRGLWQIVRYTGRPGANREKRAVALFSS